jgi:hypothetical protein
MTDCKGTSLMGFGFQLYNSRTSYHRFVNRWSPLMG